MGKLCFPLVLYGCMDLLWIYYGFTKLVNHDFHWFYIFYGFIMDSLWIYYGCTKLVNHAFPLVL